MDRSKNSSPKPGQEDGSQMILGRNPVIEALRSDMPLDRILVNPEATGSVSVIIRMAAEKGVPVKRVKENKLDLMSGGASHQGVIAFGACGRFVEIEDIFAIAEEKGEDPFIIICDEIEDPHNLGAIIRTAETVGAHGIIIPKRRSASLSPTVFKTSAGAASWLPVARVANLPAAVEQLKKKGVWIYGTDGSGQQYTEVDMTGPMGLVVGSEGFGMGRLVQECCDVTVSIPLRGKVTSLNASAAAAVMMYEILRQRTGD